MKLKIIAAVTLDGKIAKHSRQFTDWTSAADKAFLHAQLDKSDVVIVGNNTYRIARKPLSKRNCIVFTSKVKTVKQQSKNCLYVNPTRVDVATLLREKKYKTVDILGGTKVYSWFLQKNLIDEIYVTIEPIVFGSGLPLFATDLKQAVRYNLVSVRKLNKRGTVLLHYARSC